MCPLARAYGHDDLARFSARDITTWKKAVAELAGFRSPGWIRRPRAGRWNTADGVPLNLIGLAARVMSGLSPSGQLRGPRADLLLDPIYVEKSGGICGAALIRHEVGTLHRRAE